MPTSASYQLPDLLSQCRGSFELRTNPSCHSVLVASETWILGQGSTLNRSLTDEESQTLRSSKIGLLAALCFPTCDPPQLRLVADLWTLLFYSNARVSCALESGWAVDQEGEDITALFKGHVLFRHVEQRLTRLNELASPRWQARFAADVQAFRAAQLQTIANIKGDLKPNLEEYPQLLRNMSGLPMLFNLIEPVLGLNLVEGTPEDEETLRELKRCAVDVVSFSWDIFSYNKSQSLRNTHNLVSVLKSQNSLTCQAAVNSAAALVRKALQTFLATERSLLSRPPQPTPSSSSSWNINPLSLLSRQSSTSGLPSRGQGGSEWTEGEMRDVRSYIRGLRDCIVGSLNWAYETEIYFDGKGDEVRSFGWVFLLPPSQASPRKEGVEGVDAHPCVTVK